MVQKIDSDHARFRHIVKGKIKENLRRFISQGEILGKKGKDVVSIPLPQIQLPRFRYGHQQTGGTGMGDGEVGDVLAPGQVEGEGSGQAGQDAAEHVLEVEALKRQIASGSYDLNNPIVIPYREDKRYRSWKVSWIPESNAVIIYMMDVSGSMGDEQKEIVRIESFWIDTWLQSQYQGLEVRYITHDAAAREVDRDTFFHTRESGGTMISSAYKLCADIIATDYPSGDWNIYPFHFSDGDNWSNDDTRLCMDVLKTRLFPFINMLGYGQVESPYGSGQFIKDLREHFAEEEKLVLSEIPDRDAIVKSIREFLGRGR
jgi:uncharacterized sporulation protein YeaH/YhbH (DUF444 family)